MKKRTSSARMVWSIIFVKKKNFDRSTTRGTFLINFQFTIVPRTITIIIENFLSVFYYFSNLPNTG